MQTLFTIEPCGHSAIAPIVARQAGLAAIGGRKPVKQAGQAKVGQAKVGRLSLKQLNLEHSSPIGSLARLSAGWPTQGAQVPSPAVVQPDDKPLEIELDASAELCAGMAAAYVCRSIAHRAGTYAPGIHERVFASLGMRRFGRDIDTVTHWFQQESAELFRLGYHLCARRVAFRTPMFEGWVGRGDGFRAALLTTDGRRFHESKVAVENSHAVGLVAPMRGKANGRSPELEIVDPWPGVEHHRAADATLEKAHRSRKYGAILIFWSGHS